MMNALSSVFEVMSFPAALYSPESNRTVDQKNKTFTMTVSSFHHRENVLMKLKQEVMSRLLLIYHQKTFSKDLKQALPSYAIVGTNVL